MDRTVEISMFHRVSSVLGEAGPYRDLTITPSLLREHLESRRTWRTGSWTELSQRHAQGPSHILSFDDGFSGFLTHVLPLLEEYEVHAMVFVVVDYADQAYDSLAAIAARMIAQTEGEDGEVAGMHDRDGYCGAGWNLTELYHQLSIGSISRRWRVLRILRDQLGLREIPIRRAPYMSWERIRELSEHPLVTIGAHSQTHPRLTRVGPLQLYREIVACRQRLADELGYPPVLFSYPHGSHNFIVRMAVQAAGYCAAFTTQPGVYTGEGGMSRYKIPRRESPILV